MATPTFILPSAPTYTEGFVNGLNVYPNPTNFVANQVPFTRATTATRTNAAGLIELVPYNLFTYSEQFDNAAWTKQNTSVTANTAISPSGTSTADTYTVTSTVANILYQNLILTTGNYSISVYAKKGSSNIIRLSNVSSTTSAAWFDLNLGQVVGTVNGGTASIEDFGNGWYRCIYKGNSVASGFTGIGLSDTANTATAAIGSSVFLWGAQLVEGTDALPYQLTETRLNRPRVDFSLGGCPNLLLEPQRTNLFTYSESTNNFSSFGQSNTAYSSGNGFNGFQSSCKITFSTFTNSFPRAVLIYNAINGQNNYFTLHFKKKSGFYVKISFGNATSVFTIQLNLGTGELISTNGTAVGNTKVLIIGDDTYQVGFLTSTNGTTSAGLLNIEFFNNSSFSNWTNSNASDFALISGIQWENQVTYGTSYIPTTGASVTRNADSFALSNVFTNNLISSAGGTWFVDLSNNLSYIRDAASVGLVLGSSATGPGANGFLFSFGATPTAGRCLFRKYVSSIETIIHTTTTNNVKLAVKWNGTTADVFVNGVKVVNATAFTATNMDFIYSTAASTPQYINSMALWNTPLTDDELEVITGEGFDTYALMASNYNYILQ
jgi:hypothetical protein